MILAVDGDPRSFADAGLVGCRADIIDHVVLVRQSDGKDCLVDSDKRSRKRGEAMLVIRLGDSEKVQPARALPAGHRAVP